MKTYFSQISRMNSSGNMVYVSNFWDMGNAVSATVLDSGDISIPDVQYVITNSSRYDFYAYSFDMETMDLSNTREILLKYDSYNNRCQFTPFVIMYESLYYGIFLSSDAAQLRLSGIG